jgi:hypothetical protein
LFALVGYLVVAGEDEEVRRVADPFDVAVACTSLGAPS